MSHTFEYELMTANCAEGGIEHHCSERCLDCFLHSSPTKKEKEVRPLKQKKEKGEERQKSRKVFFFLLLTKPDWGLCADAS